MNAEPSWEWRWAQDQLRALRELTAQAFGERAPHVDIYDGDTPMGDRCVRVCVCPGAVAEQQS